MRQEDFSTERLLDPTTTKENVKLFFVKIALFFSILKNYRDKNYDLRTGLFKDTVSFEPD